MWRRHEVTSLISPESAPSESVRRSVREGNVWEGCQWLRRDRFLADSKARGGIRRDGEHDIRRVVGNVGLMRSLALGLKIFGNREPLPGK
jgi:hypothetical protein